MSEKPTVYIEDKGQFNLERANKLLAGLGDGTLLRNAVYNALNRAGLSGKSAAGTFASHRYTISKGVFSSRSRVKYHIHYGGNGKITNAIVSSEISFAGAVIPLIQFNARYSRDGKLSVAVKRGGDGGTLNHAFVANIDGANIYERIGKARFPLEKKYGPSAAHMMMDDDVQKSMENRVVETFNTRIEHEITRLLNGWGG